MAMSIENLIKAGGVLPFEKQPRESEKAFAAFRAYLEMGPQRSIRDVARKLGKSSTIIGRWSSKFDWPDRVAAFGVHVAMTERLAIEARAVEKAVEWEKLHEPIRREAWKEAELGIKMLREARERWEKSGRVPGFEGMARMLELVFKLKQFAAGMPSEVKEVHQTFDGKLEIEWEVALRKAYGKPETVVTVEPVEPEALPPKEGQ